MSDLFKSALGYWSSSSSSSSAPQGHPPNNPPPPQHQHHYSDHHRHPQGGQQDPASAVGEVIQFPKSGRGVRIQRLIAEGGFSYVYKGVDTQTGESVAIKKIIAADKEAQKCVIEEIQYLSQFDHPHIAKFYGNFVNKGRMRGEEHYICMEFCPVQLPTPPLRLQQTVQVFAQVCKAIKYLHEFGIVHRDIKLENVLIGADGLVKLVDFGSATMEKHYPTPDWSMSQRTILEESIAAKTTPMYRAPEMLDLWSNYGIDERADLWALGCLLYALEFGQHPFQDSNKLAITNANYTIPKGVSDSGPIVSVIRGLLKVDPAERLSFGQVMEVLVSIAESQGFGLGSPLPWKPNPSPVMREEPVGGGVGGGGGIINPLAGLQGAGAPGSLIGSGSSLFSSIKGGAASLIKNIKEQSQQYLAPVGGVGVAGANGVIPQDRLSSHSHPPPPNRPPPPSSALHDRDLPSRPPPPRPAKPASPVPGRRKNSKELEFENREYQAMNHHEPQSSPQPQRPPPPRPVAPPSPKPAPKVANLLDMSFDSPAPPPPTQSQVNQPSSNADLLDDLFGMGSTTTTTTSNNTNANTNVSSASGFGDLFGSSSTTNSNPPKSSGGGTTGFVDDLFWTENSSKPASSSADQDLLGDPLASLLGQNKTSSSVPKAGFQAAFGGGGIPTSQPSTLLNPVMSGGMPQSASFQNLNSQSKTNDMDLLGGGGGGGLMGGGIPKNVSSPNLHDLILGDIIGSTSKMSVDNNKLPASKPNYNRTQIFPEPQQDKKQTLNDVFGDLLSSQGFPVGGDGGAGRSINEMRKVELLKDPNANPTQIKVNEWREGKKKNIRALLSSLHTITWEGCSWEESNMSQMITPAQVKKTYRKACLAVHPDKQMGQDWEELAKLIFVELNEAWAAFEQSQGQ